MPHSHASDLIYDRNLHETAPVEGRAPALLDDETLRDGLQSASVRHPKEDEMVELLHHMAGQHTTGNSRPLA